MKRYGYTLAEVLITLGVIGVVSAITLPVLFANIQQHMLIARWKKTYNDFNRAYTMVQAKQDMAEYYNCTEIYCFRPVIQLIMNEYLTKKYVTSINNIIDNNNIPNYKTILGDDMDADHMVHQAYKVNNILIYFWTYSPHRLSVWIDVNGYHKPNVLGKDLFVLVIDNNMIFPTGKGAQSDWCKSYGSNMYELNIPAQPVGSRYYAGIGCSYKYLYGN